MFLVLCDVISVTSVRLNRSYRSAIQLLSGAISRMTKMTRFIARFGLHAIALGAAFSVGGGLALAGEGTVSAEQILNALKPKPVTRGLSAGAQATTPQPDPAQQAKEASFIDSVRNRNTRSLSLGERAQLAELAASRPKIDLEIQFDYNSAQISKAAMPAVQELGKALSDPSLKGATFVVAGHTDGIGGDSFNQDLSERRADTIRRYLVDRFGIVGKDLVTVGYGRTKLKDPANPAAAVNRRVQVINMETKTATK